jgi:hypothetical protein
MSSSSGQGNPTTAADLSGLFPTTADVAALLRARTYDFGVELDDFTEDTRPTAAQVLELITMAVADVRARVGIDIPEPYQREARRLAALNAATLVEASYDQANSEQSAARQYTGMYFAGIEALSADVTRPSALRLV